MQILQRVMKMAAHQDLIWGALNYTVVRAADSMRFYREIHEQERRSNALVSEAIERICPDLTVRNGPFKGMRYPRAQACGSVLFPKLLGSYERELHPIIETLRNYRDIHDVGCAEGYYLVGLGMLNSHAMLTGYDTNKRALKQCLEMAKLNGVEQRMVLKPWCNGQFEFPYGGGLIVCDVEGYESQLFTADIDADLLIEIHDGKDRTIREKVEAVFSGRAIEFVPAIPDAQKADFTWPELENYSRQEKTLLLAEERSRSTGWLWIR